MNSNNWQTILRFINNYIFATPLPEDEFQTITRDVHIDAKVNSEPEIAAISNHKIQDCEVSWEIVFGLKTINIFTDDEKLIRVVFEEIGQQKTRYVNEIIKQIKYHAPLIDPDKAFDIKLQNGILRDGQFHEVDFKEFTPYSIDIPFDADAHLLRLVDEYVDQLTKVNPNTRNLCLKFWHILWLWIRNSKGCWQSSSFLLVMAVTEKGPCFDH